MPRRPSLPAAQLGSYVAGLIQLAAAPRTAMVCAGSRLSGGDPLFTLSQVALNDTIMVVVFEPLDEGATSCRHARSDRHGVADPQRIAWEHVRTPGDIAVLRVDGEAATPRASCCTPARS